MTEEQKVQELLKPCDHCGAEGAKPTTWLNKDYHLCDDCANAYEDKTGFCSLHCCVTGNCDESC